MMSYEQFLYQGDFVYSTLIRAEQTNRYSESTCKGNPQEVADFPNLPLGLQSTWMSLHLVLYFIILGNTSIFVSNNTECS
jgi:hypothetical protein